MNSWTLVGRMDQIVLIPSFAVAGATVTMIAQNFGRGNMERVKKIYAHNIGLAMMIVGSVAFVYIISAPYFFRLFTNVPEVVSLAALQVRVLAVTFIALSASIVSASTFQATRKPVPALLFALIRMGIISIPIALFLVFVLDMKMWGVYIGIGCGNLCAFPIAFFWTKRHLRKLENNTKDLMQE
jgi:Na+-driven multidrug efflux pump